MVKVNKGNKRPPKCSSLNKTMFIFLSFYRARYSTAGRWLWHPHNSSISEFKVAVAILASQQGRERAKGKACPYFS